MAFSHKYTIALVEHPDDVFGLNREFLSGGRWIVTRVSPILRGSNKSLLVALTKVDASDIRKTHYAAYAEYAQFVHKKEMVSALDNDSASIDGVKYLQDTDTSVDQMLNGDRVLFMETVVYSPDIHESGEMVFSIVEYDY